MPLEAFSALQGTDTGLEAIAAATLSKVGLSASSGGKPEIVAAMAVSDQYFSVLGTKPAAGLLFDPGFSQGALPSGSVVLSHRLWRTRFRGDRSVLGRSISLNRRSFTIIGVAEEGFNGHLPLYRISLWIRLDEQGPTASSGSKEPEVLAIGRLSHGASLETVRAAAGRTVATLRQTNPVDWASEVLIVEPQERSFEEFRGPVSIYLGFLLALSAAILLVSCSNTAGFLLSRTLGRAGEMAIRMAVGGSRRRVFFHILIESILLFFLSWLCGTCLAVLGTQALGKVEFPVGIPLIGNFTPDLRVLALSLMVTLFSGLIVGLGPGFLLIRGGDNPFLKHRRLQRGMGTTVRKLLVATQVAGAVVLLTGSGSLATALERASSIDLGFVPTGVQVATIDLGIQEYGGEEGKVFFDRLLDLSRRHPEVASAALADFLPLVSPPERAESFASTQRSGGVQAGILGVSPGFFETLGIRILEGREFTSGDGPNSAPVAIVNQTVASILWPRGGVIGQSLRQGDSVFEVIGVAQNGKYISLGESPLAAVYLPRAQYFNPTASLILRATDDCGLSQREVGEFVRVLDADIPLTINAHYAQLIGAHLLPRRFAAAFAGGLGFIGLFLASVGLVGGLSISVAQRWKEYAIRGALGAPPAKVRASIIKSGLIPVVVGLGLGIPLAVVACSLIRSFLYGADPIDPSLLGMIAGLFLTIGAVVSNIPARRAILMDPVQVLKEN